MAIGKRQHCEPLLISNLDDSGSAIRLAKVSLSGEKKGTPIYDEKWLQNLIQQHPLSLPISEIEPGLGRLLPIATELETPAGYVDNLFVTPEGNVVLVECKLWRNPEARREVVSQCIDYAQSICRWNYLDFETAIQRATNRRLFDIVSEHLKFDSGVNEADFIDAVSKNLRTGKILILIVGDGIREGTESLSSFLQQHAGFHFTFGLIEMAIYEAPERGLLIQPRILARTLNIERGIVKLVNDSVSVVPSAVVQDSMARPRPMTMSEDMFLSKLAENCSETKNALDTFLGKATDFGIFLDPATKSCGLKWQHPDGSAYNISGITLDGKLNTYSLGWRPQERGQIELAHEYLHHLALLVDGEVRKTPNPAQWYIVKKGEMAFPDALSALNKSDQWLQLIRDYTTKLKQSFNGDSA